MSTNTGILLINLGSPDSTSIKDVKTYLDEFLMDERVIDIPWLLRALVVKGIILNTRPPKSAEAYEKIWTTEGSPLIVTTEKLTNKVSQMIDYPTGMAMRYGNPSIKDSIQKMKNENPEISKLIIVPLYPHYAMSSFETVVEKVKEVVQADFPEIHLEFTGSFYNDERYIKILSESIAPYLKQDYDHILFSYHGLPVRHLKKSDITSKHCYKVDNCCYVNSEAHRFCYKHQVLTTSDLVAGKLGIPGEKYSVAFQSRLGKDEWIKPETDGTVASLPSKGIKRLLIVCPAFVSDCLETIEEIGMGVNETFMENGGEEFTMIPCLNDNTEFAEFLSEIINEKADKETAIVE